MKGIRYRAVFKVEAFKQITERGFSADDVIKGLSVTDKSLYRCK